MFWGSRALPTHIWCFADFASYVEAQGKADEAYKDFVRFNNMSLVNIAKAGFFAADRSVEEYASRIWRLQKSQITMTMFDSKDTRFKTPFGAASTDEKNYHQLFRRKRREPKGRFYGYKRGL